MLKWLVVALVIWAAWKLFARPRVKASAATLPPVRNEAEARAILGVPAGADADAIRAAHRRLVGQVHPDRGGSAELARRVNAARDLLLANRR